MTFEKIGAIRDDLPPIGGLLITKVSHAHGGKVVLVAIVAASSAPSAMIHGTVGPRTAIKKVTRRRASAHVNYQISGRCPWASSSAAMKHAQGSRREARRGDDND